MTGNPDGDMIRERIDKRRARLLLEGDEESDLYGEKQIIAITIDNSSDYRGGRRNDRGATPYKVKQ